MILDALASESHYRAHIQPVWDALPARGAFLERAEPGGPILVASYKDHRAARRAGRTQIAVMEHGIGQSYGTDHPSYPGGRDRGDASLFLAPNETAANRWRNAYPAIPVALIGSPRIDGLPRREPGPLTVALAFNWNTGVAPESRSVLSYYRSVLSELHYPLIGHAHPRMGAATLRLYDRIGIEYVRDFDEVCRRADLYVCDNSSTIYEFASTGRPVVVLNAPGYRRDVQHGLRFWTAAGIGVNVDFPSDLEEAVVEALEDGPHWPPMREAALNIVYQPRTNGAAYAVTALLDWLTEEAEAA